MKNFRTMKDFNCQEGRIFNIAGSRSGSILLRHRHILLIISLLVFMPAFLAVSCAKEEPKDDEANDGKKETAEVTVRLDSGGNSLRRSDIFVYADEVLEHHLRTESGEKELKIVCGKGEKHIFVVANCPHDFNIRALSSLSSMYKLTMAFNDDDESFPVMGAEATCSTEDSLEVVAELTPLMCRIMLSEISSNLEDYELVESPRIRLRGINAGAALFRSGPYIPEELIEFGEWKSLPYDIGMLTQYPMISLPCYPNGSNESEYSPERTVLELECRIMGETCSFLYPLPPFGRNSSTKVRLSIDGPEDFSGSID